MSDSAPAGRRNIELKARCRDLAAAREAALSIGATPAGVLLQTDTYFRVPTGRLKLRETAGRAAAELIFYERANETAFRNSDYSVLPIPEPAATRAALGKALGVRGVVTKRRDLLMYHNVRVHLDDVEALGTFLEFEAVLGEVTHAAAADEGPSRARLATLTEALKIREQDRIARSYSDLLFDDLL